jgi:hypothetical protein
MAYFLSRSANIVWSSFLSLKEEHPQTLGALLGHYNSHIFKSVSSGPPYFVRINGVFCLRYPIHWLHGIRDDFRSTSCRWDDVHLLSLLHSRLCSVALEPFYRRLLRCLVAIRRCFKCHNDKFHYNTSSGNLLYSDNCGWATSSGSFHSGCCQSHPHLHGNYLWHLQEYSKRGSDFQAWSHAHAWEKPADVFESIVTWQSNFLYVCPFTFPDSLESITVNHINLDSF